MTTQAQRIYTHLQIWGSITNKQANEDYGIRHLPSVIRDIKKKYGVEFRKERITGEHNRFGDAVWYDVYFLKSEGDRAYACNE